MRIRPTGCELLSAARSVLRESILPHLPPDELPAGREIERAMTVAADELMHRRTAQSASVEMLDSARSTLREKLLRCLPKERQYDARLVAKAIAIATKELVNGDDHERGELDRLAMLMQIPRSPGGDERDARAQLESQYARLAAEIRYGPMDPGTPRYCAIYAHLRDMTRQAVGESHPEYLQSRGTHTHAARLADNGTHAERR
jgi:hypothetical protein